MPRRKKAPDPPKRRRRGSGSISVDALGTVRARLPSTLDPARTAREFPPGHMAEAIAWLDTMLRGEPAAEAVPAALTLGDWSGSWWLTYVAPVKPPTTARIYLHALRQLEPVYSQHLDAVRPSQLQGIVGAMAQRLEPDTIRDIVGVWRRCFTVAVEDGLIGRNPASRLVLPPTLRRPPARYVTAEEVALLWPAIRGHRFEPAYALMLGCGLRIGEILGLHWERVDFVNRQIWVQEQFTNGAWRPVPKGKNPHAVPLPDEVAVVLRRHRQSQPDGAILVMESPHKGPRSRHEAKPRPWSRSVVADDLSALVASLGLEKLTPHAGRHGLASHLLANGINPTVIADLLGNSAAVVLATYVHATPEGIRRADLLIDTYLSPPEEGVTGDDTGDEAAS